TYQIRSDILKTMNDYQYVYENWYCESCKKSNEEPVPFYVYCIRTPLSQVRELKKMLDEGMKP
uniref:hypothetical protein n=1 Tax=Bacillus thuringiensis TaxID=1428 RepID=UPI001CA4D728